MEIFTLNLKRSRAGNKSLLVEGKPEDICHAAATFIHAVNLSNTTYIFLYKSITHLCFNVMLAMNKSTQMTTNRFKLKGRVSPKWSMKHDIIWNMAK